MSFAVATTNTGSVFSCIHVRKVPNTRALVPPSVLPLDCDPERPFSISSIHNTHGDMVLADLSNKHISPHAVMAVTVEDAVYLKRVEKRHNGILLRSDNPEYTDMELCGDELDTFGIIGKIVWLCRDCRCA